jgi:methionyl-tRNA formyltransferase
MGLRVPSIALLGSFRHVLAPFSSVSRRAYSSASTPKKPLRILFCGSDPLSNTALGALHEYQKAAPDHVKSIDVLCRSDKRSGRGLKILRSPPIKSFATSLGLRVHQRDTFTGWDIPPARDGLPINLIIAVSFGLFVPPRILRTTEYGGLNIHPSLLPDLPGPSPIHFALLHGYESTGITLQTLSPEKFDHGKILLQERFDIPDHESITPAELTALMGPACGRLLVEGIRKEVYLPGYPEAVENQRTGKERHAPKIRTEDMEMSFRETAKEIATKERVFGKVFLRGAKRVLLHGLKVVDESATETGEMQTVQDPSFSWAVATDGHGVLVRLPTNSSDQELLYISEATVDGAKRAPAARAFKSLFT